MNQRTIVLMSKRVKLLVLLMITALIANAQHYKKIHDKLIVADTHNDILIFMMKGLSIDTDLTGKTTTDLNRLKTGGVDIQVFSVFCDETFGKDTAFKFALLEIDTLNALAARNPEKLMVVHNMAQIKQAIKQKKLAALIGVEGGHMIEDNLANLDSLYKRGVRYLTLTWNNSTAWASSAKDETNKTNVNNKYGLSDFGKSVVQKMNAIGMMIDVSHNGEQTFNDVMAVTTKPVLASHSCVYKLAPHSRNLKDDQIKAIAKNGGVIQLNFYSGFLDSSYDRKYAALKLLHKAETDSLKILQKKFDEDAYLSQHYSNETNALRPPISVLFDHIDYIIKLVGIDHVGLGGDFDGAESSPLDLEDVTGYPNITKELLERGYSKKEIKKIMGGNFLRALKENMN